MEKDTNVVDRIRLPSPTLMFTGVLVAWVIGLTAIRFLPIGILGTVVKIFAIIAMLGLGIVGLLAQAARIERARRQRDRERSQSLADSRSR